MSILEQCILDVFTMYLCYATPMYMFTSGFRIALLIMSNVSNNITRVMPNSGRCERQIFELCNFLSLSMRVTQNEFACHL